LKDFLSNFSTADNDMDRVASKFDKFKKNISSELKDDVTQKHKFGEAIEEESECGLASWEEKPPKAWSTEESKKALAQYTKVWSSYTSKKKTLDKIAKRAAWRVGVARGCVGAACIIAMGYPIGCSS